MIDLLKSAYLSLKEDLSFFLEIEDPLFQDLFAIFFVVLASLLTLLMVKNAIEYYKLRKENKKIKRNIEKTIVTGLLSGTDKNKEENKK